MSTTEEVHDRGSTRNPTRSLCDPYVFNTAVTRARSLVVAVGNPFFLLRMEQQVVRQHGKRGNCWSTFLKNCIQRGTLQLPKALSEAEQKEIIQELQTSIEKLDPDVIISERDVVISERDAVISERDAVISERDAAISECERLREELRAAKESQVRRSTSVPYTVESLSHLSPAVTVPHYGSTPVRTNQVQQPYASPVLPTTFVPNVPSSDASSELRKIHQPDHDDVSRGLQQHPAQYKLPPSNASPHAGFIQSPLSTHYIAHPESESSSVSGKWSSLVPLTYNFLLVILRLLRANYVHFPPVCLPCVIRRWHALLRQGHCI